MLQLPVPFLIQRRPLFCCSDSPEVRNKLQICRKGNSERVQERQTPTNSLGPCLGRDRETSPAFCSFNGRSPAAPKPPCRRETETPRLRETPGFRVRTKISGRSGHYLLLRQDIKGQLSLRHADEFAPNQENVTYLVTSLHCSSLGKQPKIGQ